MSITFSGRGAALAGWAVAAMWLLTGCVPLAREPVGGLAAPQDAMALLGSWRLESPGDVVFLVAEPDPARAGEVVLRVREQDAGGAWREDRYAALPTRADTLSYVNVRYAETGGARSGWIPVRYGLDDAGRLALRMPDSDALAGAIRTGRLAGSVRDTGAGLEIDLAGSGAELAAAFASPAAQAWFGPAQVFVRQP